MLKRMTVPITVATELQVSIDGVTAKEHQRATRFVVIWRIENHRTELDRSLKAGFAKVIGKIIIRVCAEIILAKMRNNVCRAGRRLKRRRSKCEHRVKNRKFGADHDMVVVILNAALELLVLFCDNRANGALAAGCGKCGNNTNRKSRLMYRLHCKEIPYIAVVRNTDGNRLRAVDGRAAADGKDKVNLFPAAQFDTFINGGQARVWHNTTEINRCNTSVLK